MGMIQTTEADTCRKWVVPKLVEAGWEDEPHAINEQRTFTDGRIVVAGGKVRRKPQKRADYILRYTRDFPLAVVEAKASFKGVSDGLQQAKDYAEILGLKFAFSTNGRDGFVEFDYFTGKERSLTVFPSPDELWARYRTGSGLQDEAAVARLLSPFNHLTGKSPRYYQEVAINRTVEAIAKGRNRILLTMATGTGKTVVAFQICWKLWNAKWNRTGAPRKPRILYLADRNILIDDPKDKTFAVFGDARFKIEGGKITKGRELYFAIYQSIAEDENRPGLYKEFDPDFFDLIIVDECHRGSARDESQWRDILEWFKPAFQLGMTATPLRDDNRNTYKYFGNPIYTYSLRQGIDDGFLAPYRVHRIVSTVDAAGWRPTQGELDRFGREVPDGEYGTKDFERVVALRARTEAIARHLSDFLKKNGRWDKTIVFCVDQDHADEMRRTLTNLNSDLVQQRPDYVARVTSDEGGVGRGHLSNFQELERATPVILTTSKLLTTGVDAPTCKNIVLARVVNSMVEFKQIIGRGTRVRDDYGKLYFNILDYTGSASQKFADPDFDGDPVLVTQEEMDEKGKPVTEAPEVVQPEEPLDEGAEPVLPPDEEERLPRKYYVDEGWVEIAAHLVYELDADGKQLRVVKYTDYTGDQVRTLCPTAAELQRRWGDAETRARIIEQLEERGVLFEALRETTGHLEADPFDLLCHLAYNAPLRTRRERAERLKRDKKDFFEAYGPQAKAILSELLEKYAEHGLAQFSIPDVLKLPPISEHGNVSEIVGHFGGAEKLREAVNRLQNLLYAA